MDAFCGTWKLATRENLREYLEQAGLEEEHIDVSNVVKPVLTYSQDGDTVTLSMKTSIRSSEVSFKLGEEFDETTMDGRICKSVVNLEGEKLVHVRKWDNNDCKIIREVKDSQMNVTLTCNEVVAVCIYEKL